MAKTRTVFVTGATGQQGGALARLLLKKGHRVRALTRKPDSPAAQELKRLGAEIATGKLEDRAFLERAAAGVDALFAVSTPYEAGPQVEVRQGIAVADAARGAGVKHLIFTSVGSADRQTGIPHFDSKHEIEQHIQRLGVPYTILGPVFFMDNFLSPWFLPGLQQGKLALALPATRPLQQIAVADIAAFAALVLERGDPFVGKRFDLASDELTGSQAAEVIARVSGRSIEYVEVPIEEVRASSDDWAKMFTWFDQVGYSAPIAALRQAYPEVGWHTFESWAKTQNWGVLQKAAGR